MDKLPHGNDELGYPPTVLHCQAAASLWRSSQLHPCQRGPDGDLLLQVFLVSDLYICCCFQSVYMVHEKYCHQAYRACGSLPEFESWWQVFKVRTKAFESQVILHDESYLQAFSDNSAGKYKHLCMILKQVELILSHRWETGYWNTMDIAHDRAGYYLCWGCLNWVPAIYTSQPLLLASNPYHLPTPYAVAIFILGTACIYINYDCDRQRQVSRLFLPAADRYHDYFFRQLKSRSVKVECVNWDQVPTQWTSCESWCL